MKRDRHIVTSLVFGIALGVIVACGGSKSAYRGAEAPAPAATMPGTSGAGNDGDPRAQINQLDAQITADLEKLALPRPTAPPLTPPEAMSAGGVQATSDPSCKAPLTPTCGDSCKLADSICENAGRICGLAGQLGNDAWANEKCSSGTASCEAARKRCCNCT